MNSLVIIRNLFLCVLAQLIAECVSVRAQYVNEPPLRFKHFNWAEGMSKGAMTNMYKDSKGFVWIATTGGINRYDGSEFKIFRCDAADSTTISNGPPMAITEDKNVPASLKDVRAKLVPALDPDSASLVPPKRQRARPLV